MIDPHFLSLLRCPDCGQGRLAVCGDELACRNCPAHFPLAGHRPVMLRHGNSLFAIDAYSSATPDARMSRQGPGRFIPSPSVNLAAKRVLVHLAATLDARSPSDILIVGGGCQRAWLDPILRANAEPRVLYSDIDIGADVDLFCDGHDLPFVDGAFDAVVTTAVLEHVMYPERVAGEITRVLKPGGLLYSEMPFMQQVHEGAYDFTRYTLSGHRRLFNGFDELDAGMVAGPATALVWSIENLALALVTGRTARKIAKASVRLVFGWIKYLDHFLEKRPEAMDGASCTYFFGAKATHPVDDAEIIRRYVGGKHFSHV